MVRKTLDTPLDYRLTYEPSCTFIETITAPIWVLELMVNSEPTDIKWYAWEVPGGYRSPWGTDTKFHDTLASALTECLLNLLQYSDIVGDADETPYGTLN
jgi:hypothetical protein